MDADTGVSDQKDFVNKKLAFGHTLAVDGQRSLSYYRGGDVFYEVKLNFFDLELERLC